MGLFLVFFFFFFFFLILNFFFFYFCFFNNYQKNIWVYYGLLNMVLKGFLYKLYINR